MSVSLSLLALTVSLASEPDVSFVDASLDADGRVLDARFVELVPAEPPVLVLIVLPDGSGDRELRLHRFDERGVPAREASWTIPVLADVAAYGFADVREEPGRELLFFTSGGVFSCSTALEGLRGNIERLARTPLVFDVPDPDGIEFWDHALDVDRGVIVLPAENGFSIWGPSGGGIGELSDFADVVGAEAVRTATRVDVGGERRSPRNLIAFDKSYRAPALADVDGDGRRDLLLALEGELRVHLATADGLSAEPTRIEAKPDWLDTWPTGELIDVDGDGDADLVARQSDVDESTGAFDASTYTIAVALNEDGRILREQPSQVLRFEAMELRHDLVDVDGDGRVDLVVRKFDAPSLLDTVTGLEFRLTSLLYLSNVGGRARDGRVFQRRPALKDDRTFDEQSVQGAIASRKIDSDFDGDGIVDLVEVGLDGRVAVRRLRRTSGFLRGDGWALDSEPWRRFEGRGSIQSISVDDVNGDGLGDVVSRRERSVLVLLSRVRR